ncbi:Peptidyl-prolyl cis-trans isomerase FKBP62 (PPIase FKBP62) (70 kDa peptidyl-prolyl isomerase) (FK506-binding protein 62) (AtFKBP62) (Immunophilin FKBP62) (Peptidylprolyl isomerase ROF1) (Protein ROTAMASE FKBP 1) (Rotamase) [Durusdinium trenchii]|uniref:Uncharacterized protein n=1 Tax=Durusdinium trenchii TaxID=1381693 RepID=A0ABP0LZT2_9DINO
MTFSERWCRCGRHHRRQEPNAITINTNDVSGRSTPSAVSYDGKLRHVGVNAEGRLMSAPKQTLSQLVLALSGNTMAKRAEKYQWLFPFQEDGRLGPVTFDGDDFAVHPAMPLASLLRTLSSYAGTTKPKCVAVPDFFTDAELATVSDAVKLCELAAGEAHLLRHSSAVAMAFGHSQGSKLFPEGAESRTVGFVDVGSSHGTVSVVKFYRKDGETFSECLYRCSEEELGVQSMVRCLLSEAISRIEQKHKCKVLLKTKSGIRLSNEVVHALKQLSMLPDAELGLEAFLPEGPEGPEIDVSVPLTRHIFETAAAEVLKRLKEALVEALAFQPEAFELLGGGSRIPAVQARVKEVAGELPLRFGLDGASCVATGAAAWAAGRRWVDALDVPMEGLAPDVLESIREQEAKMEAIHSEEVKRLEKRNALESYVYQVRDWMNGKDGNLLNPEVINPYLDKVVLWFEDADMAEEPTTFQAYSDKLSEVDEFIKKEGAPYFEKKAKDFEDQEKEIENAAAAERERRKEHGMDFDKDERVMKKEDRMRLAQKNKDEGNDMFKAQKFDDAVRRYKKAIEHVSRPEVQSNLTPEEAEEAKKIKVSCHLNSAQCYIKAGEAATQSGGKNAAELFYKKARTSCDDVLELDASSIKAIFRRSLCYEKLGELEDALKDIKKGLGVAPEDADLKKSQDRLQKLLKLRFNLGVVKPEMNHRTRDGSYGRVADVHIPNEPLTRCHKGYAFVTMTTASEAQDCIRALHGAELGGQGLLVEVAKRSTAYAKTPGIYLGKSTRCLPRPAEPGLLRDEAALAEPLSEPAAAAQASWSFVPEPMEPGGEPLTEEDPVPSPSRRCEAGPPMPPMPVKMKEVTSSPRSRISQLEAANVRAAAQQTADSLLLQFQRQGFADPHNAASQCLQSALELLSPHRKPTKDPFGALKDDFPQRGVQALVAPEEFKNPSTFLRVYGDPAVKSGHQWPESMQDRRDLQRGRHVAWCSAPLVLSVALSAWSLSAFSFTGETAPCRSLSPRLTSLVAGRSERPAVRLGHDGSDEAVAFLERLEELFGSLDLLSPKGVPSEEAVPLGRWALQPPSIGRSNEWDTWDYLQALLGERWWGAYAWEYWRFLCHPRSPAASSSLRAVQEAAVASGWWRQPEHRRTITGMLKTHGFLVLDNFLPASLAEQLCSVASRALQQKQFGQGKLSTGASFARGDAVLWVNTRDPAAEALENMRPEEGQSSASIPELKEVLEQIDTLVAEILAPEFPERMGCIRTRSHAMFTCYPGAREAAELVDAQGESWAGPCASSSARGYLRHLDNERAKGHCGRILTTILYLNPDWQPSDGGGIRLFEVKPPLQVRAELLPHANRLLCFWADEIPHEVLPPKRDRFACTFWYLDRDADPLC